MHEICENCEIYERGMGASCYTPRVCSAAVWFGSGEELPLGNATGADLPQGSARQLDGNGGMRVA